MTGAAFMQHVDIVAKKSCKTVREIGSKEEAMGYYTDYKLRVIDPDTMERVRTGVSEEIEGHLSEISGYGYVDDNMFCGGEIFGVKWYEYRRDMKAASLKFPDVILVLEGVGEETGDHWREYWKNGYVARYEATIMFPELNAMDFKLPDDAYKYGR